MTAPTPDRKTLITDKALTLTGLARRFRVTIGHFSRVVSGERRSPRLERRLAQALGMEVKELFPRHTSRNERPA